jgi:hypothetical protein
MMNRFPTIDMSAVRLAPIGLALFLPALLCSALLCCVLLAPLLAQPPVAPTPQTTASAKGEKAGDYTISQGFEVGYRFADINGDVGKYRSDVNFRSGLRLLSSSLAIHSRTGQGAWFDEISLFTRGLGNDPYQSADLRVRKNNTFDYTVTWRENQYFNPALLISNGQHSMDTVHRLQDQQITLFPTAPVRILLEYQRNTHSGPALTTTNLDGHGSDEFLLFAPINQQQNGYRLGLDADALGIRWSALKAWDYYKEEIPANSVTPSIGNNILDRNTLESLNRNQTYRGSSPFWRFHFHQIQQRRLHFNGRYTYVDNRRRFRFDEALAGADRFGSFNRQLIVAGFGRRPVASGHWNITFSPGERWQIANHSAFHHTRMEGDNQYREISNVNGLFNQLNFQFLGIRTFSNDTQLTYRWSPKLTTFAGFQVASRRIRSIEQAEGESFLDTIRAQQSNTQRSGLTGVVFRPIKSVVMQASAELGRNSRPFYPVSDQDFHSLQGRITYTKKSWRLQSIYKNAYNFNGTSLSAFAARSKSFSLDSSYSPRSGPWSIDASFSRLDLRTLAGIVYFNAGRRVPTDRSLYLSNLYTGSLGVRTVIAKRADLYIGYTRVQDRGDGRSTPIGSGSAATLAALQIAQVFPVTFESPSVRLSVPFHKKLRWNAGYQYYRYREEFSLLQNYGANTGFTSLTWSF